MKIPDMTEHRKLKDMAQSVDTLQAFARHLNDNDWTVVDIDNYGEVRDTLKLTDEYLYNRLGIDIKKLEEEREQAVQ